MNRGKTPNSPKAGEQVVLVAIHSGIPGGSRGSPSLVAQSVNDTTHPPPDHLLSHGRRHTRKAGAAVAGTRRTRTSGRAPGKWGAPSLPSVKRRVARHRGRDRRGAQCYRFLQFEVTVEPDSGPIVLTITGPPGTADFLDALIRE